MRPRQLFRALNERLTRCTLSTRTCAPSVRLEVRRVFSLKQPRQELLTSWLQSNNDSFTSAGIWPLMLAASCRPSESPSKARTSTSSLQATTCTQAHLQGKTACNSQRAAAELASPSHSCVSAEEDTRRAAAAPGHTVAQVLRQRPACAYGGQRVHALVGAAAARPANLPQGAQV